MSLACVLSLCVTLALGSPYRVQQTSQVERVHYSKHTKLDFRRLPQYAAVPSLITDAAKARDAPVTSDFFKSDAWTSLWTIQNWNNSKVLSGEEDGDATYPMVNTMNNIYIERNTDPQPASETYLTMRTARHRDFQSAAEFESVSGAYRYLSMRMYARTVGAPGACTSMFTYRGDVDPVQEADVEFLTRDPVNSVQYTNQPSTADGEELPQATRNATNTRDIDYTRWAEHRFDWQADACSWYIDGTMMAQIALQTPFDPTQIIFNAWGDGGTWTGKMDVGQAAYLQIMSIDIYHNNDDVV